MRKMNDEQLGFVMRNWDKISPTEMNRLMGAKGMPLVEVHKAALKDKGAKRAFGAQEVIANFLMRSRNLEIVEAYNEAHELCSKLQDYGFATPTLMDNPETGQVYQK